MQASLYSPPKRDPDLWEPELGENQRAAYWDPRLIVLQHGERYSGKTFGALHALVRHVFKNMNATGLILTIVKSTGSIGGIWDKLKTLDRDENDEPLGVLEYWREHIGLKFGEPRKDASHNDYIEVENQYGFINRIYFKSLPPGELIAARTRGIEYSFGIIDEISLSKRPDHVTKAIQQLNRKKGVGYWADEERTQWVPARQQLYLCTNPPEEGPEHWLFEHWFIKIPERKGRAAMGVKDGQEGKFLHNDDPEFGYYHIPISQNRWVENKEEIMSAIRAEAADDPTAEDRMIHGRWIKKVVGLGIFQHFWIPNIHIPNYGTNTKLLPIKDNPIIVGWDPGEGNIGRSLLQRIYVRSKRTYFYRYFDCLFDLRSRKTYEQIVAELFDKLNFWNRRVDHKFNVIHIADAAAFDKWINESGSFENANYEMWSRLLINSEEYGDKYSDMHPILFDAPPKGKESVPARVRMMKNLLQLERIIVCQSCHNLIDMFAMLKKKRDRHGVEDDNVPRKDTNGLIHLFDSASYPVYYYEQEALDELPSTSREKQTKLAFRSFVP